MPEPDYHHNNRGLAPQADDMERDGENFGQMGKSLAYVFFKWGLVAVKSQWSHCWLLQLEGILNSKDRGLL